MYSKSKLNFFKTIFSHCLILVKFSFSRERIMAIRKAERNAKYSLIRGHVCKRPHGCTSDIFTSVWRNCELKESTQWSSLHLCATIIWKDILLIPHFLFTLRYKARLEWTILWEHGKLDICEYKFYLLFIISLIKFFSPLSCLVLQVF